MQILELLYGMFVLAMFSQALINIYLTLYVWEIPERIEEAESPKVFLKPKHAFTVLLPARFEQKVIGETIRRIADSHYPKNLLEIIIICEKNDLDTVRAAKKVIIKYKIRNAKVVQFSDGPITKPHGLNIGLSIASKSKVVIFDAEDNVHPDIFNIANTLYETREADVIQAGVQLMNYDSRWFSSHNVLEYYFWFRSRMHFHAKVGMVPLGGNTVFFKTRQLQDVGGWDETCLTEDAEIGVRLSAMGAKVISTYDAKHVTKEETPATVMQFIKQRTRWNQGFIQILRKGTWLGYEGWLRKAFCFYTFSFPFAQTFLLIVTPIAAYVGLTAKMPVVISLLGFLPLMVILLQLTVNIVGLYEFTKEQGLKPKLRTFALMIVTFIPYQLLLTAGAIRATWREVRGEKNWEKTSHEGKHRSETLQQSMGEAPAS